MNTANTARNSIMARLLASENLTVQHSPDCETAYFELDSRRLVLPQWDNKDQSVYDFLVGHEVGHAKYTPADAWKEASIRIGGEGNAMVAKDYINVIEDARIERMIKREFPGLRRDFICGYQALSTMDAFNLKGRDLASLSTIDRLNIHFKMGIHLGVQVPFSAEEMKFVDAINAARTFDDVTAIAAEVYEFAKNQKREREQQSEESRTNQTKGDGKQQSGSASSKQDGENGEEKRKGAASREDGNDKSDSSETREAGAEDESERNDEQGNGERQDPSSGNDSDESAQDDGSTADASDETDEGKDESKANEYAPDAASTVGEMQKAMKKFVNNQVVEHTIRVPQIDASKVVVTSNEFIAMMDSGCIVRKHWDDRNPTLASSEWLDKEGEKIFKELVADNRRAVDQMCRRFEVRRAARNYARESSAKTGRISCRNLAKYKFSEDIFERMTIKRDEKNHGIVILLDWSGSMSVMINDTVSQLAALLMFCRRVGIPAEVYFFTNMCSKFADDRFAQNNKNALANKDGQKQTRGDAIRYGALPGMKFCAVEERAAFTEHVCHLPSGTVAKGETAVYEPFSLVQVYDQNMDNKKFAKVMGRLALLAKMNCGRVNGCEAPSTLVFGGTPLDESILAMRDIANNFRKSSNTKVTFITLTDGEGMSVINRVNTPESISKNKNSGGHYRHVSKVMVDAANGRRHTGHGNTAVVEMFKDATGCDVVGIMMMQSLSYCSTFERLATADNDEYSVRLEKTKVLRDKFDAEKFVAINNPKTGYASYFFVQVQDRRRAEELARLEDSKFEKLKNKKVAATRAFIAAMKRDEVNRMFLNRLMDIVA